MSSNYVYSRSGRILNLVDEKENSLVISGNVLRGPQTSIDHSLARFNGTSGEMVENTNVLVDNDNNVSGFGSLELTSLKVKNALDFSFQLAPNTAMNENLNFILPSTDGFSGQCLMTDGNGNLEFSTHHPAAVYAYGYRVGSVGASGLGELSTTSELLTFTNLYKQGIGANGVVVGLTNFWKNYEIQSSGVYEIRVSLKVFSHSSNAARSVTIEVYKVFDIDDNESDPNDTGGDIKIGESSLFFPVHSSQFYQNVHLFKTSEFDSGDKIYFKVFSSLASSTTTDGISTASTAYENTFLIRRIDL